MARTKTTPKKDAGSNAGSRMKAFAHAKKTPGHLKAPPQYVENPVSDEQVKEKKRSKAPGRKEGAPKPRRFHPGTVSLRQIRKQQKNVNMCMTKAGFRRWLRAVCDEIDGSIRFFPRAVECLHEAMEDYLVKIADSAQRSVCQNGKIKLTPLAIGQVYDVMRLWGMGVSR